jgi:DNA-binding NarL/FixJ family response regulator
MRKDLILEGITHHFCYLAILSTDRESEVLSYIAKGFRDKELAEILFLNVDTVRTHLRNIYRKLHVRTRTEAALKYLKKDSSPDKA